MMKYVHVIAYISLFMGGVLISGLWNQNKDYRAEINQLERQAEITEFNIEAMSLQLKKETKIKEAAQKAYNDLKKDVGDEVFNEPLDESIQSIIDEYHSGSD